MWLKIRKVLFFWRKRRKTDSAPALDPQAQRATSTSPWYEPRIILSRRFFTDKSTIGALSIDGGFECWVLEDPARKKKIPNITAIPEGTYEVVVTHSPKFKKDMPLLKDVPNYTGIRIHPGNWARNTSGCLLPGKTRSEDFVGLSRQAFQQLFLRIKEMIKNDRIYIRIFNEREGHIS